MKLYLVKFLVENFNKLNSTEILSLIQNETYIYKGDREKFLISIYNIKEENEFKNISSVFQNIWRILYNNKNNPYSRNDCDLVDYLNFRNIGEEEFALFVEKYDEIFFPYLERLIYLFKFSEFFLQKYLSEYCICIFYNQYFSEDFYIKNYDKYFNYLNIENTKNCWKYEENRSSKLKIFLRLKGVK